MELTTVVPVSMAHADARHVRNASDKIILYGKYKLSEGNQVTVLRDAQRLTLIYTKQADELADSGIQDHFSSESGPREIRLNITYLQE